MAVTDTSGRAGAPFRDHRLRRAPPRRRGRRRVLGRAARRPGRGLGGTAGPLGRRRVLRPGPGRARARSSPAAPASSTTSPGSTRRSSECRRARRSAMDPQHRLLLETAWRAVEHSGTAPTALANTRTGVFVGLATHDYLGMASDALTYPEIEAYLAIGTSGAAGAGRISYRLGLQGPAVTVDTACSSSLVAIHQACQALRLGECDLALAGGANVILSPATMITFSQSRHARARRPVQDLRRGRRRLRARRGLRRHRHQAPRGRDPRRRPDPGRDPRQRGQPGRRIGRVDRTQRRRPAAGHHRGAGARRAGPRRRRLPGGARHRHVAGRSHRGPGRRRRTRQGTRRRPPAADRIGEDEHRTSGGRRGRRRCAQGRPVPRAPGTAQAPELPQPVTAHSVGPDPGPGRRRGRRLGTQRPAPDRRESVRSGSPAPTPTSSSKRHRRPDLRSRAAPVGVDRCRGGSWCCRCRRAPRPPWCRPRRTTAAGCSEHPEASLADVCLTAGAGARPLRAPGRPGGQFRGVRARAARRPRRRPAGPRSGARRLRRHTQDRVAVPRAGQPVRRHGPGVVRDRAGVRRDHDPVRGGGRRRARKAAAGRHLRRGRHPDGAATLQQTRHAQPAIFAVEMGLARLWQSWGFEPDVVLGHSVGQYSAACVAGVFSLEDGARLLAERGRLFGDLPAGGRMAAIFADPDRVERLTDEFPSLSVAAYNGANTVLSGPGDRPGAGRRPADRRRCPLRLARHQPRLPLGAARSGSRRVRVLCERLRIRLATTDSGVQPDRSRAGPQRQTRRRRTGAAMPASRSSSPRAWRPWPSSAAHVLLEVGPQPVLTAAALRAWPDPATTPKAIPSLRRNVADHRQITEALAERLRRRTPARLRRPRAGSRRTRSTCRPTPSSIASTGSHDQTAHGRPRPGPGQRRAHRGRPAPRGRPHRGTRRTARRRRRQTTPTAEVLNKLAAQHNRQRSAQSIADVRYEIRWEKSRSRAPRRTSARGRRGCSSAMTPMRCSHWSTR